MLKQEREREKERGKREREGYEITCGGVNEEDVFTKHAITFTADRKIESPDECRAGKRRAKVLKQNHETRRSLN